jgi:hypothetical protein
MTTYARVLVLLSSSAHEAPPPAFVPIVVAIGVTLFMFIWNFPKFCYEFSSNEFIIRHRILGRITIFAKPIPYTIITDIRRFDWSRDLIANYVYRRGNYLTKPAVVLVVKGYLLGDRVLVIPHDPDSFIRQLKSRVESANSKN